MKERKNQSGLENFTARTTSSTCSLLGKRNAKLVFIYVCFVLYPLGTKVMCLEGGCVCCVLLVTRCDLSTSKDGTIAVNSVSVPCDVK